MGEYDYRPGTGENFGFEYEDQMIAYLAVAACNQKDLKDFWIASNIVGLGAWDDVVLYTEYENGEKKLQFLQLKHKANLDTEIKLKDCKEDLKKYARDYEQLSSLMSSSASEANQHKIKRILNKTGVEFEQFEFIIMTNATFKTHPRLQLKSKDSFIKTNITGPVYQLLPKTTDVNTDNNFFEQLFIFSEQSGVNDKSLLSNIENQLKQFITHTNFKPYAEVANCFPTALKNWFLSENRTLSLADVKENISSCILTALKHNKPINCYCPALDKHKWSIFQKMIEPYQLVVYSNRKLTLENFFDESNSRYFINCKVSDVEFVINCLKAANNIKVIMLVPNESLEPIAEKGISTLNLLNALPVESLAVLNNYDIHIQGRKTKFGSLLNQYSDIKNIFTVDDVINTLLGKLCIGEGNNFHNYYIPRFIPRIFVERSIILEMANSFFVVIVKGNVVESELIINSYLQSKLNDARTETPCRNTAANERLFHFQCVKRNSVSEALSKVGSNFHSVHILKYHKNDKDFLLEWLSSSGNIKEVKNYIEKEIQTVTPIGDNLEDLGCNFINKVIIVANPGMGKTYFVKYLANNYPVNSWVILIILNEIDFDKTETFQTWLEESHIKNLSANDKQIFELYLKKKSVVVLFDGFDEVAPDNNQKALDFINEAVQEKLKIVITSREVTRLVLEENFDTIAYTLNPFSNDDKQIFLKEFYTQNIKNLNNLSIDVMENKIYTFASNLLKNCSLSNWDEEFTGVPLQCRLLAEGFIEDCQRYCATNDLSTIHINTNLITLYEKFIHSKFDIYWKEKEQIVAKDKKGYEKITKHNRNVFFSNHMDAAVQIIFPKVKIKISKEFFEEIKCANERHGIIIGLDGNNNPIFVHRTFAEYFAAKWLVKIKEKEEKMERNRLTNFLKQYLKLDFSKILKRDKYLKFLLNPQYNVVKDLFDRIVCKQCELHTAILNAELSKVRDVFEKNGNRDDGKCGRNALHLISARGARHEKENQWRGIEREGEEKYLEILEFLLENGDWKEENDNVLRWTPQQYANQRNAFGVIDRLCGFKGSELYSLKKLFAKWNKEEILKMCYRFDYSNIGTNIVDLKILTLNKAVELLEICAKNDSVRFAEKVIQSMELNSQQLTSMTYKLYYGYDEEEGTLLHIAAQNGSVKILDVLLKYIDVNIKNNLGQTPLHVGCEKQHVSVVKLLVQNGGDLFLPNGEWETPMDIAVYGRTRGLVEYVTSYDVLKLGFAEDINAVLDTKGRCALHYAAKGRYMTTLERLIAEGANVNISDNEGNTALHCIADYHCFDADVARRLIESGLDIDAQDSYGNTALHLTVTNKGNKEGVEFLLQYKANPNIVNGEQRTALSLAREWGHNEIFLILWEKTEEEFRSERDVLHKSALPDLDKEEVRKKTFVGYPQELSHLVDTMAKSGLYYSGVGNEVRCFSCKCMLFCWLPSDDPWFKHTIGLFASNCQFLIKEKGKEFIDSGRDRVVRGVFM